MSVRADLSVPATDFVLGSVLGERSAVRLRLECAVPLGDAVAPCVWVSGLDLDDVVAALRRDPDVTDVIVLEETDEEVLVDLGWDPGASTLFELLVDSRAALVEAVGSGESWSLRLRFPDREPLGVFFRRCRDRGVDLSVERVVETDRAGADALPLTDVQRETLQIGFERGYFDVPRGITLVELADELGVSDTAVSQRLRRGVSTLLGEHVTESTRQPSARQP